jgi:hypothetical protein
MKILCINVGVISGMATFEDGKLTVLSSGDICKVIETLFDESLNSVWIKTSAKAAPRHITTKKQPPKDWKAQGQAEGIIHGLRLTIETFCARGDIKLQYARASTKDHRYGFVDFKRKTGWNGPSDQHERDADMLFLERND